jgi:hypothetical protein
LDGLKPQRAPFSTPKELFEKRALWGRAHTRHNLRSRNGIVGVFLAIPRERSKPERQDRRSCIWSRQTGLSVGTWNGAWCTVDTLNSVWPAFKGGFFGHPEVNKYMPLNLAICWNHLWHMFVKHFNYSV